MFNFYSQTKKGAVSDTLIQYWEQFLSVILCRIDFCDFFHKHHF